MNVPMSRQNRLPLTIEAPKGANGIVRHFISIAGHFISI